MEKYKSLLPESISDLRAESLERVLKDLFNSDPGLKGDRVPHEKLLIMLIHEVPPMMVPYLAQQFNLLEGFEHQKGNQAVNIYDHLRKRIELERYKGTKYAVEEVLKLFGLTDVTVVDQRGSSPDLQPFEFTLKRELKYSQDELTPLDFDMIRVLINCYKNVRSRLVQFPDHMVNIGK